MVTLTIKYSDGSMYWQMFFNTMNECNKWLNEEKTRPYWNNTKSGIGKEIWTTEIIDLTPTPKTPEEIEAERKAAQDKQNEIALAKANVSRIDPATLLTLPDIKDAVTKILSLLVKV